jgi:hypothetical protein
MDIPASEVPAQQSVSVSSIDEDFEDESTIYLTAPKVGLCPLTLLASVSLHLKFHVSFGHLIHEMDGWLDGRMAGWMEGWMVSQSSASLPRHPKLEFLHEQQFRQISAAEPKQGDCGAVRWA